jgi:hypothetical protein
MQKDWIRGEGEGKNLVLGYVPKEELSLGSIIKRIAPLARLPVGCSYNYA